MSSENVTEKTKYTVDKVFNATFAQAIYKEVMVSRKYAGNDAFTYAPIERSNGEKTFIINARHVTIAEAMSYSNKNCKHCYGTGKKTVCLEKRHVGNTEDFIILASKSLAGLTEEQKMAVVEEEKKGKFWNVLLPCHCTIKGMLKKDMYILSNDMHNIVVELSCEEKAQIDAVCEGRR